MPTERNAPEIRDYASAKRVLGDKESVKLCHNTYLERVAGTDWIAVRLHRTCVVTYRPDGTVVLYTGGYRTVTTKDRLNRFSPFRVWQDKGAWWYGTPVAPLPFEDGMTLEVER